MLIWGFKTEAAFDLWSLEHLANGVATAATIDFLMRKFLKIDNITASQREGLLYLLTLLAAVFWECAEHYLEAGLLPGAVGAAVVYWFQGVEHWTNRLLADNLMMMTGAFIYTRKNRLALGAKIFSLIWMAVHVLVFPHSMYLHTFFRGN